MDGSGTNLPTVNATVLTSDVVATQLVFSTQPSGSTSGSALTAQPVVIARDANNVTDTGYLIQRMVRLLCVMGWWIIRRV